MTIEPLLNSNSEQDIALPDQGEGQGEGFPSSLSIFSSTPSVFDKTSEFQNRSTR